VLGDRDLLGCVLGFVGGETGRQSVRALGQVALVCRQWREMSLSDGLWEGVEEELVPVLWEEEEEGGRRVVGRDRLVRYGRLLVMERRIWSEDDWAAGLELQVEVFDRMDGLQMLSARVALEWRAYEEEDSVTLYLDVCNGVEVRGPPFSAGSRDPDQERFATIEDYFNEGHQSDYPCSLCVRVTVRDQRTGKVGLLWEDGKETGRRCITAEDGSILVASEASIMVEGRGDGLRCSTGFYICSEPDQEGVAEEDMLYRVAEMIYAPGVAGINTVVSIEGTSRAQIGSMIRSLC
jgi:hypothetical protein